MQFQIRLSLGREVRMVGHELGDFQRLYPTTDSGTWKVDVCRLETILSEHLADVVLAQSLNTFNFRFELADVERWGEWFSRDGNAVSVSQKSRSLSSVGQLRWSDVKDLDASQQFERLKGAIASAIANAGALKRKPKGFDAIALAAAVQQALAAVPWQDVTAVPAA